MSAATRCSFAAATTTCTCTYTCTCTCGEPGHRRHRHPRRRLTAIPRSAALPPRPRLPPPPSVWSCPLCGLALQRPASLDALAALPGVPRATAQRFGPELLECVAAYCARYRLPQTTPPPPPPTASVPAAAAEGEWRAKRPRNAPAGPPATSSGAAKQRKLPKSFR